MLSALMPKGFFPLNPSRFTRICLADADSGMMFSGLQRSVLIYSRILFRFQRCVLIALSVFVVRWL